MVHTTVDLDGDWHAELFEMFEAATRIGRIAPAFFKLELVRF